MLVGAPGEGQPFRRGPGVHSEHGKVVEGRHVVGVVLQQGCVLLPGRHVVADGLQIQGQHEAHRDVLRRAPQPILQWALTGGGVCGPQRRILSQRCGGRW